MSYVDRKKEETNDYSGKKEKKGVPWIKRKRRNAKGGGEKG